MYRKQAKYLLIAVEVFITSLLPISMRAQTHEPTAEDAPLVTTALASLQDGTQRNLPEVVIRSWYFLGPYRDKYVGPEVSHIPDLDHDYLADGSYRETQLDAGALEKLCGAQGHCVAHANNGPIVDLLRLFPGARYSVTYAAAILDSTEDGYIGLQYDISFGAKLWVNGTLASEFRSNSRHPVAMYTHFAPVHIHKGANVLLLKTNQGNIGPVFEPWAIAASLMPIDRMWDFVLSTQDGVLLSDRLLGQGEPLHLPILDVPMMLNRSVPIAVSVTNRKSEILFSKTIAADDHEVFAIPRLDPGYYRVRLNTANHVIEDAFYVGDPEIVYNELRQVQKATSSQSDEYLQRDAIIRRYEILTSAQYKIRSDYNWQKKLMMAIDDAEASMDNREAPQWYTLPGQHLREFVSTIDGTHQNYFLDIPKGPTENRGLVIVMPYAVSKLRPFLESAFISYSAVLEQIREAADENHLAVAIIDGRGNVGDAPIGEADAFEVLKDISSHYSIDPKRIYLYGVCEGARRAILLAEHYPGVFAAVGGWGPGLYGDPREGENGSPVLLARRIAATPVVMLKGDLDSELPNQDLVRFGRMLEGVGNQHVTIQIVPNAMHDPIRMESVIFPLLARFDNDKTYGSIDDIAAKAVARVIH